MRDIEHSVMDFLTDFPGGSSIGPETELMQAGILDSVGLVRLIMFLESEFRISIADSEIAPDSFASPAAITAFVKRKQS